MDDLQELVELVGQDLPPSPWFAVSQERIDQFADATDDHQWIHADGPESAAGPYGGAIAHGYLVLALLAPLWPTVLPPVPVSRMLNYGLNRVRFTDPVPAGSLVRLQARLRSAEPIPGGLQIALDAAVERQGSSKPVVVAEPIYRLYA